MPIEPLLVYLDSSDYSTLSDPKQQSDALLEVRSTLLGFTSSGQVRYVFSGAHLSEMAPLIGRRTTAATLRADLLVELCDRCALISLDKVIRAELGKALACDATSLDPISSIGDWYPDLDDFISPVIWANMAREIDTEAKRRGINREQRRELKRQLFKAQSLSPLMRHWLAAQSGADNYADLLRLYPMRPTDAEVLGRYILGTASKEEAELAFLESLRDPRWMMRWFSAHGDKMTPVTEWMRAPARTMIQSMREMIDAARKMRQLESELGSEYRSKVLTRNGWAAMQDKLVTAIADRLAQHFFPQAYAPVATADVDRFCPGLSTMIRSLHGSLWDAVALVPREPLESDFVDAVHSLYAPYVDIFRADRFMAPHIRRQVERHGTCVVSRLTELPNAIRTRLGVSGSK